MLRYIEENVVYVENFCRDHLPQIRPLRPQASFLIWLDCRGLNLSHDSLVELFVKNARLALNDGVMFGAEGEGYMRLNIGCPRSILREAMEHLARAINE